MNEAKSNLPTVNVSAPSGLLGADRKRRMQPNPKELKANKYGYHAKEHDEDPTCHKTHDGDTPCLPVESP